LCRFAQVADIERTVSRASSKRFSTGIGRGVVVTISLGRSPKRNPCSNVESVSSGCAQKHNSSAHAASNCGPRKLSGSSAEKQ
jgi:hypothetical protein